ncbi:MAG: cysteine desulfurase [Pseudomonadota bacterium]
MTVETYPIDRIRADFPILAREVHGKPLVYLDNGASAQKPTQVLNAVRDAYENEYANVHRGLHFLSNAATDAFEAARGKVAKFLNAPSDNNIVWTSGTTDAINLVAYGWAMPRIEPGDEIVLSILEHHSNIVPWHFLRERHGAVLKWVDCDESGAVSLEAVEAAVTDRTKLIAITHMSNVTGAMLPITDICAMARERGIRTMIDGSQGAVHMPVDVQALGCDFYCITGHKLYGPSGIGALYGTAEVLEETQPFKGGGEMILDVTMDDVTYNDPPHRFEAGTPPIVQAIGLGAAIDYIESIGREAIAEHENDLRDYCREQLHGINALKIIGDTPDKGAIFSFEIEGVHAHDVSMVIDRSGVAVRAGTHCAQPLMKRFGVTSTCRASFGLYNTREEVDILVASLEKARKFFA